jgi:hypothetical protein
LAVLTLRRRGEQRSKAVDHALQAGYLVPEDAKELKQAAAEYHIGA